MNKTKIVIVGGGFGGVYTAKYLYKLLKDNVDITIINKNNYFLFTPLLHEVATGGLSPKSIVESLREIFRGTSINYVEDTVNEIDRNEKIVKTNKTNFKYDYLVLSPGAETNYFNTPGAQENTFTLKNLNDAITLRNHIIDTFEKAVIKKDSKMLSFAIIGAGATGVELASELIEYLKDTFYIYYSNTGFRREDIKVTLITNTSEIIGQFPIAMRNIAMNTLKKIGIEIMTNATATNIEPNNIKFSDGKNLQAHTIIWVAGVKPSLNQIKGIEIGPKGRIETNEFLQSKNNSEIFSLGDAGGSFPMLAQIAVQQAKTVASNINKLILNKNNAKLEKFSTNIKGLLISLGQLKAIGDFKGYTISGPFMWFIWRTIYLFNFNSWKKRFEIVVEWTINLFYPRDINILK